MIKVVQYTDKAIDILLLLMLGTILGQYLSKEIELVEIVWAFAVTIGIAVIVRVIAYKTTTRSK
jgi:uncharacterized membrane protein YcaP (DUF421 family)